MVVLPILTFCTVALLRWKTVRSIALSLVDATVLMVALALVLAEVTSLFTAYGKIPAACIWCAAFAVALALLLRCKKGMLKDQFRQIATGAKKSWRDSGTIGQIILILIAFSTLLLLARGLIFRPESPDDAEVYHIPRAYMFYKYGTIHNMPVPYSHFLYTAPLNSILMSQIQILSNGSDRGFFFVQYGSFLFCMLCAYEISIQLGAKRSSAVYAAAMVASLQLARLQALTEQNDLLVSAFCMATVLYMICAVKSINVSFAKTMQNYCFIGLACGLAAMSKISAGLLLLPFCVVFAIYSIARFRLQGILFGCGTAFSALAMVTGHWVRTGIDLQGDFLAMGMVESPASRSLPQTIVLATKNLFTPVAGTDIPKIKGIVIKLVSIVARLLSIDINDPFISEGACDYTTISFNAGADGMPYTLQAIAALVAGVILFFLFVREKRLAHIAYIICSFAGLVLLSTGYVWCISISRYLLAGYMLLFPLTALLLDRLETLHLGFKTASIVLVLAMLANCNIKGDTRLILKGALLGREEPHSERILQEYQVAAQQKVLQQVNEKQIRTIGIYESPASIGPVYIWISPFLSSEYDVRFINANYHAEKEALTFTPEAIIAGWDAREIPQEMYYHGHYYTKVLGPWGAFYPDIIADGSVKSRTFSYYERADLNC